METTPVTIVDTEKPIPVRVEGDKIPPQYMRSDHEQTLAPTTTKQEDVTTAGQRRINLIWEITQASIALLVTASTVISILVAIFGKTDLSENKMLALMQLVGMTLLILGFYFSRTNHQAIGGIGKQPSQKYEGR